MTIEKTLIQIRNSTFILVGAVAATAAGAFAHILGLLIAGSIIAGLISLEFYLNFRYLRQWVKDHEC